MLQVILMVVVIVVQLCAPTYISILIALVNLFLPDSMPIIDEALNIAVVIGKLKFGG